MIDVLAGGTLLASAYPLESGQMHSKQSGRYEVIATLPKEAQSVRAMFQYARVKGLLRSAYIHNSYADDHDSAVAVGGVFGFETASYEGVSLHVNVTTSQYVSALNHHATGTNLNSDFFDTSGTGFTYLSHMNLNYEKDRFSITAGRLTLNTPYADADDIRMAANSFEGIRSSYDVTEQARVELLYVTRWAGHDATENQYEFTPLVDGGLGLGAVGLSYVLNDENSAALWYYRADAMSHILYAEYSGHYNISENFHIEYGLQGSVLRQMNDSNVQGAVIGLMGIVDYGSVFCGIAFNRGYVDANNAVSDGFGGGPYYTSLDEATLGTVSETAQGDDVMAYRLGVGYRFTAIGMTVEGVVGQLRSRHKVVNIKESDCIVTYNITEQLSLNGSLMAYHSHDSRDNVNRVLVKIDYSF